jgi:hypothetical protein
MSKRFLIIAISVGAVGVLLLWAVPLGLDWLQAREFRKGFTEGELAAKLAEQNGMQPTPPATVQEMDLKQGVRLAVGGIGLPDEEQNRRVSDLVLAQLAGAPGLEMVERQSLDVVLQELNLSVMGLVRAKDAVRVGKLLRTDWFLLGSPMSHNGTNFVLVRIVDARTGIMRDAGVLVRDQSLPQLAVNLANFVRQCRQDAAMARTRTYLAVGAFEDLSVNNRQADFPSRLRAYLTAAYRGGNVTLLERECVDTLLREVRLDLAGLIEQGGATAPVPMQSAFWLVTGQYQSYETTNFQVELNLDVERVFGRIKHFKLRGLPGGTLDEQVKQTLDQLMAQDSGVVAPTRVSEVRAQIGVGKELVVKDRTWSSVTGLHDLDFDQQAASELALRLRNTEAAISAFKTALLLDPGNREAKMYLAVCLRRRFVGQTTEAREYYREILEENIQDQWTGLAQTALVLSFSYWDTEEKASWFAKAVQQTTNSSAREFYQKQAEVAADTAVIERGGGAKAIELAWQRMLAVIRSNKHWLEHGAGGYDSGFGMSEFAKAYQKDATKAARALVEYLPQLKAEFPELTPYLLAAVTARQVEPNAEVVAEFQRMLDDCIEHPERVFKVRKFWPRISFPVYFWSFEKTNYHLAVKLMEGYRGAAAQGNADDFNDEQKIRLAYAYLATEQWRQALEVFESFADKPVQLDTPGPWGRAFIPILPAKMAAHCRNKLGLGVVRDSREFELDPKRVCMHAPSAFAADSEWLWLAISGQLIRLDFDLKTNLVVNLPIEAETPISCLAVGTQKIWIGTGGEGLLEFDKASRTCRRYTEADGLLMDNLTGLHATGESLWIGYGRSTGGGLGHLDMRAKKFKSFMPSLNPVASKAPPRQTIANILTAPNGDVWVLDGAAIRQFDPAGDTWETLPNQAGQYATSFSADSERMVLGVGIGQVEIEIETKFGKAGDSNQTTRTNRIVPLGELHRLEASFRTNRSNQRMSVTRVGNSRPIGGAEIHTFADNKRHSLVDADGLPNPPTTMTVDGPDLWVGGEGFITLVDLKEKKVRKYCHIRARTVDRIQIAGGYIWTQFDNHLHRVALPEVQ